MEYHSLCACVDAVTRLSVTRHPAPRAPPPAVALGPAAKDFAKEASPDSLLLLRDAPDVSLA